MDRFVARRTDGWLFLIADAAERIFVAESERSVDFVEAAFTHAAFEALLVPVRVLVLYILQNDRHVQHPVHVAYSCMSSATHRVL